MINIRIAITEDLPELAGIFDQYRSFYRQPPDRAGALQFLQERIQQKDAILYVAAEDGSLLGFTQLYPLISSVRMKRCWLLNDLFVLEAHRERGISKQLIAMAKQLAIQTGAAGLLLETDRSNAVGNHLYPSMGFALNETSHFYWWQPGQ